MMYRKFLTRTPAKNIIKNAGFSLLEMSVVLAIVGVVAGGMLTIGGAKQESAKAAVTAAHIKEIETAFVKYSYKTDLLPCPAEPHDELATASFGISADCDSALPGGTSITAIDAGSNEEVWVGTVPTRSLNLSDAVMLDGWGNRIKYVVVRELTRSGNDFNSYSTSNDDGVIKIVDKAGNQIVEQETSNVVAYALISHGRDGGGAYRKTAKSTDATKPSIACDTTTLDADNCTFSDNVFMDSRINDSDTAGNYYFDYIKWKTSYFMQPKTTIRPPSSNSWNAMIAAAVSYTCGINIDKRAYCWGVENSSGIEGRLGDGGSNTAELLPKEVNGNNNDWISIAADYNVTCGIRQVGSTMQGKLYCWGFDNQGSSGLNVADNTITTTPTEVLVGGITSYDDWSVISVDNSVACALRSTGNAYCWGVGNVIGDDTSTGDDEYTPTELGSGTGGTIYTDWTDISTGYISSCAIRNSELYCWASSNNQGELGGGSYSTTTFLPEAVNTAYTDWVDVESTHQHNCALRSNNELHCWGKDTAGQIGQNTTNNPGYTTPQLVGTDYAQVSVGVASTCAIKTNGTLWCWGRNDVGQLGVGNNTQQNLPMQVGTDTDWSAVSASDQTACGIKTDGSALCWGRDGSAEFGDGSPGGNSNTPQPAATGLTFR